MFKNLQNQLTQSIYRDKQKYFNTKCYWSLLKTILNTIHTIQHHPYLLFFITTSMSLTIKKRVKLLILFFTNQYSLIPNNSILPSELKLLSENTLPSCDFSETDILQIINGQDWNKAHSHDMISIPILKLCDETICRPVNIIFKTCLNTDTFLLEMEKGNVFPIHKKRRQSKY